MMLTNQECNLIKKSWMFLEAKAGISNQLMFYESFFEVAPEARRYFESKKNKIDFELLKSKFSDTMNFIVNNIENLNNISKEISELGSLHNQLKIEPHHYSLFNESVLTLLDKLLGDQSTNEVRAAWKRVLDFISQKMQEAPAKKRNRFNHLIRTLFGNN